MSNKEGHVHAPPPHLTPPAYNKVREVNERTTKRTDRQTDGRTYDLVQLIHFPQVGNFHRCRAATDTMTVSLSGVSSAIAPVLPALADIGRQQDLSPHSRVCTEVGPLAGDGAAKLGAQ